MSNYSFKKEIKVVFTGKLSSMSRKQAAELVEKKGCKVENVVNKNINFVVMGEDAGSRLNKAKSLGIKVLCENEFLTCFAI